MSQSDNGGCLGIALFLVYILAWIGSGTIAWNWIQPTRFTTALIFLLVWGIIGYIAQLIGMLVLALLGEMMNK